jgi:hypothetical protein
MLGAYSFFLPYNTALYLDCNLTSPPSADPQLLDGQPKCDKIVLALWQCINNLSRDSVALLNGKILLGKEGSFFAHFIRMYWLESNLFIILNLYRAVLTLE